MRYEVCVKASYSNPKKYMIYQRETTWKQRLKEFIFRDHPVFWDVVFKDAHYNVYEFELLSDAVSQASVIYITKMKLIKDSEDANKVLFKIP